MSYASFGRRIFGAIIESFILTFLLMSSGGWIITTFGAVNLIPEAPFVIINMIYFPLDALINTTRSLNTYENVTLYYLLFIVFFFVEVIYYSIMEILPVKATIGHLSAGVRIKTVDGVSPNVRTIILRNCLKVFSRYLLYIPFFAMLFTKNKQTIYDMLTSTVVVNKE